MTDITLTISGNSAWSIRNAMETLLGSMDAKVMPAVSDTSSDKPTVVVIDPLQECVAEMTAPAPKRTRKPKAEPAPVAPTPAVQIVETTAAIEAETAAQDAADEAAETETTEDAPLTLDDVRNAVAPYIAKWTIAVAQADVGHLIKDIGGADKISELDPANQQNLRNLVAALNAASASDTRYVKAAA